MASAEIAQGVMKINLLITKYRSDPKFFLADMPKWTIQNAVSDIRAYTNGVAGTESFLRTFRKNVEKFLPRYASKIGATLKGKNLLPEGANSFLKEQPYGKEAN